MTRTLSVETLEARDTPTTLTGPLGGTLTATSGFDKGVFTESVTVTGPAGQTLLTEQAQFTLNPRTEAVSGTVTVAGAGGRMATGQLTGQMTDGTFTETTVFTGPAGKTWTQHGVYVGVGTGTALRSTVSLTGPGGNTATKTGMVVYDPAAGTVTVAGEVTGPQGKSFDWNRTLGG